MSETYYDDYFKTRTVTESGRAGHPDPREKYVVTDGLGQAIERGEKIESRTIVTRYEYKPFNLVSKVFHGPTGAQSTTEFGYDLLGRQTSVTSPDTGTTTTFYNAFGETRQQNQQDGNVTTFDHDGLGRITRRTDQKGMTSTEATYHFDSAPNGVGQMGDATRTTPDNVKTFFSYEPTFGGLSETDLYVPDGNTVRAYATYQTYDSRGRVDTVSYPDTGAVKSRFAIRNVYGGANGMLSEIREVTAGASTLLWQANEREPLGRIQKETLGSGAVSTRAYTTETGRLQSIESGSGLIQSLQYTYYADGSVFVRNDALHGLRERFDYDGLGRLAAWRQAQANDDPDPLGWSVAWTFDDRGNLTGRATSAGTTVTQSINQHYNGGAAAPHRLDDSDLWPGKTFGYDPLGNVNSHPGVGTIDYTPFNLPRKITTTASTTDYLYDAFGSRVRKVMAGADSTTYVGGIYERRTSGSEVIHVLYVQAEGRVVTQITRSEPGGVEDATYIYGDHLRSTHVLEASDGSLTERRQDPFGNTVAWDGTNLDPRLTASPQGSAGAWGVSKGFTGHEEEGELGVVNMGGRIYDARLGRFLEADPLLGAPGLSNGWNRYAYGLNNPTRFTDPTGFYTEDQRELTLDDFCLIHPNTCVDEQFQSPESMVEEFGTYDVGPRLGDADRTARNMMVAAAKWESRNQKESPKEKGVRELEGMLAEARQAFQLYDEAKGANNMAAAQAYLDAATDIANRSIAKAMQVYGIDPQRATSIRFDVNLDARGKTSFDGKTITIGTAAFENEGRPAAGRFAATIFHETVHSVLSPMNGVTREEYASDPAGHERPVYGVELSPANVKRFGLTDDDVAAIRRGFEKYYGEPL